MTNPMGLPELNELKAQIAEAMLEMQDAMEHAPDDRLRQVVIAMYTRALLTKVKVQATIERIEHDTRDSH